MAILSRYQDIIRDNLDNIAKWRLSGYNAEHIAKNLCVPLAIYYTSLRQMADLQEVHNISDTKLVEEKLFPSAVQKALGYTEDTLEPEIDEKTGAHILDNKGNPRFKITKRVTKYSNTVLLKLLEKLDPDRFGPKKLEDPKDDLVLDESIKDLIE